jgi:hypothetical protein
MTAYDLPDIVSVVGTLKVKLYSEFAGLTVPTVQTIKTIGDLTETAQRDVGISEMSTLQIDLRDDRSTYSEGFWFKVLNGDCRIRFYLSEGGTNKFYFFGTPQQDSTTWTDWAIVAGTYYRTASITLVSVTSIMMDTAVADWAAQIIVGPTVIGSGPTSYGVSLKTLFASLLYVSGLNSSVDESDITFVYYSQDLKFKISTTEYTLDDLWIKVQYNPGSGIIGTDYFKAASGYCWAEQFDKVSDLLSDILFNFDLYLHMDYDPAGDSGAGRHKMYLIQRGRAYDPAANLTFGTRLKASTVKMASFLLGDAVIIRSFNTGGQVWRSKMYQPAFISTDPPVYVKFDIDRNMLFSGSPGAPAVNLGYILWAKTGVATWAPIDNVEYWDYTATPPAYVVPAQPNDIAECLAALAYNQFTTKVSSVTRTYSKLKANDGSTDSFTNLNIGRKTSIDLDGAGNVDYYANKVTKKVMSSEIQVEWIKE